MRICSSLPNCKIAIFCIKATEFRTGMSLFPSAEGLSKIDDDPFWILFPQPWGARHTGTLALSKSLLPTKHISPILASSVLAAKSVILLSNVSPTAARIKVTQSWRQKNNFFHYGNLELTYCMEKLYLFISSWGVLMRVHWFWIKTEK